MHRLEMLEQLEDGRATRLKVLDNHVTTAQLQSTHKKPIRRALTNELLFCFQLCRILRRQYSLIATTSLGLTALS